jgi:uncharacterized protein (DUF58 family)
VLTSRAPLALAVAGLPALFLARPWPWLVGASTVVALLILADLLIAAPATEVVLRRDGDRQVRAGSPAAVRLTVSNHGPRTLRGLVRDAWVPSAGARPAGADDGVSTDGVSTDGRAHLVDLHPGEEQELVTELRPHRRGERAAVRVTVRSYGPLGLAYRQTTRRQSRRLTPPWTLRVMPPFHSRRFLPEKLSRLRIIEGQVATRGRGQGSEFDSLREYVVGDDIRSIDWRATARAEHVVVKTWRPERDRRVMCVLDTGRTSAARVGDQPRLDASIDAALLLTTLAAHAGDQVDLLAVDADVRASVSTSGHRRNLNRLIDATSTLEPALTETDFGRVVAEVLHLARRRALVVLFTALEPGALGEGLLPVLPLLLARHRVVVAAVRDPALDALAAARRDPAALYTAAAAEKTLATRRRVHAALARRGTHVVEAPPDTFAGAVADAYLDLKAAGRL